MLIIMKTRRITFQTVKIMKKMIFALLIISFILSGCFNIFKFDPNIEYDVGIPSITISGENTFGCKIDKVAWRAENEYSSYKNETHIVTESTFTYDRKNDSTIIIIKGACFRHVPKAYEKLSLEFRSKGLPKQNVTYILGENAIIDVNHFRENNLPIMSNTNKSTNPEINLITFTRADTTNKIVAGLFEGQIISSTKNMSIITDGRFDVLFKKILYQ